LRRADAGFASTDDTAQSDCPAKIWIKNVIQSILHSHLIPSCPHADLGGTKGRSWLSEQVVPQDERLAIDRHLRELDRLGEDLQVIERDPARSALANEGVKWLVTPPVSGLGATPQGRLTIRAGRSCDATAARDLVALADTATCTPMKLH
jgi:hypothetical protein